MKKTHGFTLIEMMIVVAIIGILTAIAYPSYLESIRKSNRSDAKAALNDAAGRMERCYTINSTYDDCATANISSEKYYTITANTGDTTFTITATPAKAPQTGDTDCPIMSLDNLGERLPDNDICW